MPLVMRLAVRSPFPVSWGLDPGAKIVFCRETGMWKRILLCFQSGGFVHG